MNTELNTELEYSTLTMNNNHSKSFKKDEHRTEHWALEYSNLTMNTNHSKSFKDDEHRTEHWALEYFTSNNKPYHGPCDKKKTEH